jgi:pimeloyl-ACP methyl ester carboxylesterase
MGAFSSTSSPLDSSSMGEIIDISTHLGNISMRVIGKVEDGKIPIICIPGASPALVDEWVVVVGNLIESGHVAAILNFHSNSSTKPGVIFGGIQPNDVSKIINEAVLRDYFRAEKAIIMGKSWGGYMASKHTIAHSDKVRKLVLQAPAFSTTETIAEVRKTGVPTFLAWAKDDPLVWFSGTAAWLDGMGENLTLFSVETGGHAVVAEYSAPILTFLQQEAK